MRSLDREAVLDPGTRRLKFRTQNRCSISRARALFPLLTNSTYYPSAIMDAQWHVRQAASGVDPGGRATEVKHARA
jgi:hypothetical protein